MHLAQLNIARLKYPFDDPRVAEFVDNLGLVNGIAERSDGFVWRLTDESEAAEIAEFADPSIIMNLSAWRDAEALERFVWNTVHKTFYQKRTQWFEVMKSQHFVMWWIDEAAAPPSLHEAKARLDHLDRHGDSDHAFGWSHLSQLKLGGRRAAPDRG